MLGKLRKPEHKVAGHLMSVARDMDARSAVGTVNARMLARAQLTLGLQTDQDLQPRRWSFPQLGCLFPHETVSHR